MGTVSRDGVELPTGMQLIAPHLGEEMLFTIGSDIER
jgi:Asp-tRNA(Asn)/Glu-tRNA(Gln) amidotransferase A subunit family amidase